MYSFTCNLYVLTKYDRNSKTNNYHMRLSVILFIDEYMYNFGVLFGEISSRPFIPFFTPQTFS